MQLGIDCPWDGVHFGHVCAFRWLRVFFNGKVRACFLLKYFHQNRRLALSSFNIKGHRFPKAMFVITVNMAQGRGGDRR